jgi:hypothetical protein
VRWYAMTFVTFHVFVQLILFVAGVLRLDKSPPKRSTYGPIDVFTAVALIAWSCLALMEILQ